MKKNNNIFKLLAVVMIITILAVGLPALGLFIFTKTQPKTYGDSYYGALALKYDRLKSQTSQKIIVVGGSSVAFGIDSSLIEKELGVSTVNFGLYAAYGLKPMLDLSIGEVNSGDIVVIAPELSSQMYSDYVGTDELMMSIEGRPDMANALGMNYKLKFLSHYIDFISTAAKLRSNGGAKTSGVYAKSSFNERGDMTFVRENNAMDGGYIKDNLPEISKELVTDVFADMINEYVANVEKKGAKVYFSFCPINALSMEGISEQNKTEFVKAINEKLDCQLISSLDEHILEPGYFYDSNFHTNDAGTIVNTVLLINDLKRITGIGANKVVDIEIPAAPALPGADNSVISTGELGNVTYAITKTGVEIVGISPSGESAEIIEIPSEIEGVAVTKIGERAFAKAKKATTIILPETITVLSASIFEGAEALQRVELNSRTIPEVGNHLLDGAASGIKIYVKKELYANYVTDYFWGQYEGSLASLE